jgi:NTE family protein
MCLPGLFAPLAREGKLLVDGGVLDSLPVGPMALTPEGPIVAVDVGRRFEQSRPRGRLGGRATLPTVKETLARSIVLGSINAAESSRAQADLLIEPETGSCAMLDFKRLDEMVACGRAAAREALARHPAFAAG